MTANEFDPEQFLAEVLKRAGTQAEIGRVLGLESSRVADLYKKPGTKNKRRLYMTEGLKLAERFDLWPFAQISVESLIPVLRVALRYPPKGGWTDQGFERLAQDILFGLGLQQELRPERPIENGQSSGVPEKAPRAPRKPG